MKNHPRVSESLMFSAGFSPMDSPLTIVMMFSRNYRSQVSEMINPNYMIRC